MPSTVAAAAADLWALARSHADNRLATEWQRMDRKLKASAEADRLAPTPEENPRNYL